MINTPMWAFTASSAGTAPAASTSEEQPLFVSDVNEETLSDFIKLVEKQADFHESTFTGSPEAMLAHIQDPLKTPNAFLVYDKSSGTAVPVAYVLYYNSWDQNGRQTYLEDIHAVGGNGAGSFAFNELKSRATKAGSQKISWAVMRENPTAISFYKKQNADTLAKDSWDLSHLFNAQSGMMHNPGFSSEKLTHDSLVELHKQYPGLNTVYLSKIISDPNSEIFISKNHNGKIIGYGISNTAYSSFRTVDGIQIEHFEVLDRSLTPNQEHGMFASLTSAMIEYGRASGRDGHLYAYAKHTQPNVQSFYQALGADLLCMNEKPSSVFQIMGIDLDQTTPYAPSITGARRGGENHPGFGLGSKG